MQQQQQHFETPAKLVRLVRYNIVQPLAYPELYSADAYIPILRCLAVYGRQGNHIVDAIWAQLDSWPTAAAMIEKSYVEVELGGENDALTAAIAILGYTYKQRILVVENAERWVTCPDYEFQRSFAAFGEACHNSTHCIVLLVFHAAPSEIPPHVRATLMTNAIYFPCPSEAWRRSYFHHIFSTFAAHVQRQGPELSYLSFSLTDDDYTFLAECAVNLTPDQIRRWCEALFIDLYEMRTHSLGAAGAQGVGEVPTPALSAACGGREGGQGGVHALVVDLEYLKTQGKLHSIAGLEWQLLLVDGNALENKYSIDAGDGALAVRDAEAVRARKRALDQAAAAINVGDAEQPPAKRQILQGDGTIVEELVIKPE